MIGLDNDHCHKRLCVKKVRSSLQCSKDTQTLAVQLKDINVPQFTQTVAFTGDYVYTTAFTQVSALWPSFLFFSFSLFPKIQRKEAQMDERFPGEA